MVSKIITPAIGGRQQGPVTDTLTLDVSGGGVSWHP